MSRANRLWGAPRIHGELRKLGIGVAQRTVAKYMLPGSRRPSSQTWTTFLRDHLGVDEDTPEPWPVQGPDAGEIMALPQVGGLHHRYERRAA